MNDDFQQMSMQIMDAGLQGLASCFSCGNPQIDAFIRSPLALDRGFGRTFILASAEGNAIIGFFNIAAGSVDQINEYGLTKMGGAIHINELAIDVKYQGFDLGNGIRPSDLLLDYCLFMAEHIRDQYVGCSFVTLQATNAGMKLYKRHGFIELEEDMRVTLNVDKEYGCTPMYLPLDME